MLTATHDLSNFGLADMIAVGNSLRQSAGPESLEQAAQRVVETLNELFVDPKTGRPSCALVRLYRTECLGNLNASAQEFARTAAGSEGLTSETRCLALAATIGDEKEWCSVEESRAHRAIALPSEDVVAQMPMVAQLIKQFGLEMKHVTSRDPNFALEPEGSAFNVFHVEDALGSAYVPAQADFVVRHGITSVLGFGGTLPRSELFAVILFSRTHIPRKTAELFKTVALSVKIALLPCVDKEPAPIEASTE